MGSPPLGAVSPTSDVGLAFLYGLSGFSWPPLRFELLAAEIAEN